MKLPAILLFVAVLMLATLAAIEAFAQRAVPTSAQGTVLALR